MLEVCRWPPIRALEGMTGIEPALSAWEAEVLPLNYIPEGPCFLKQRASCTGQLTVHVPRGKARTRHGPPMRR